MAEHWSGEVDVNGVLEPVRDEHGRWIKGTPPTNPGGYSKADRLAHQNVREAAKEYTPQALKTLANVMNNVNAPPSARVSAASVLLDRAWGKPMQPVSSDSDTPLIVEIIQRVRRVSREGQELGADYA